MLGDLTEQDFIVILAVDVDGLAGLGHPNEVTTFPFQLDLFTIRHEKFFGTTVVLDLSTVSYLVLGLMVDEDS